MKSTFLRYYYRAFLRPQRAFDGLVTDQSHFLFGFGFIAIPGVLYTLMYVLLTIGNGAPSSFTPWLNIPMDEYYYYNRFLLMPSLLLSWIFAAGTIQILAYFARGKGTFEHTLSALALAISVAMWSTLLHDLIMSFLSAVQIISAREHEIAMNSPTIWRTLIWTLMTIYLLWFCVLFSKATAAVHRVSRSQAVFIGVTGFVAFQVVFLIFNR